MKRLLLMVTVLALAVAKPELYREKEDFKYSRSSSGDGSKSGFYDAQKGNMGGNFERAHNMDGLAQHQMSGLVRQVQGELGEGSQTRTGSVFTAANSKGVYGSGNYDLSNLEGRNFQEGVSIDDSQSQSLSSHAGYNAQSSALSSSGTYSGGDSQGSRYHSGSSGYSGQSSRHSDHTYDNSDQSQGYTGQVGNLQELESTRGVRRYDYGGQEASGHYSQSGYHGKSGYDHSSTNSQASNDYGVNAQSRLITGMPVRVVIRPGTRVSVPIAAQTFDTSHTGTSYDQNSVNSDAEVLSNQNHHNVYRPTGQAKHYESAYSYHKEWEKHGTKPVLVPTENPFPKNSELYEDAQAHLSGQQYDSTALDSQSLHSSNAYSGYNANVKSTSSNRYQHQSNTNDQHDKAESSSNSNANTYAGYNSGLNTDVNNQNENVDNKPKSYQSSYSYHKSWERQGDPYVIKPVAGVNGAHESQKIIAGSSNDGAWSAHQYGSRSQKNNQYYLNAEDCDCEDGSHVRVARSYNTNQQQQRVYYDGEEIGQQAQHLTQQTQNKWEDLENLGQQTQSKWDTLEESGQQTENQWGNLETAQQVQNQWDKPEDAGQQTQNKWDKLEDLGQQTQNQWNSFGEQARPAENVEQENQNSWMVQPDAAVQPDLNQQSQNTWMAQTEVPVRHDLHQQKQNTWMPQSEVPVTHDLNQQTQNTWMAQSEVPVTHDLNQQTQNTWMAQSEISMAHKLNQETQNTWTDQSGLEVQHDRKPESNWDINKPSNQEITDALSDVIINHNKEYKKVNVSEAYLLTGVNYNTPESSQVQSTWNTIDQSYYPYQFSDPNNSHLLQKEINKKEDKDTVQNPQIHNTNTLESTTKPRVYLIGDNFNNKPQLAPSAFEGNVFVPVFTDVNKPSQLDNPFHDHFVNNKPWGNEHQHTYFNQNSQSHNLNFYDQSHKQTDLQNQDIFKFNFVNSNEQTTKSTDTLSSLWDKIETIEKQLSSNNEGHDSVTHTETQHVDTDQYLTEKFPNKPYGSPMDHYPWHVTASREKTNQSNSNNGTNLITDTERGDIPFHPEEYLDQITTSTEKIFKIHPTVYTFNSYQPEPENKHYKTPAEIESLSQTLNQDSIVKLTTTTPQISTNYEAIIPIVHDAKITEEIKVQTNKEDKSKYSSEIAETDELNADKTTNQDFVGEVSDQQNTEQQFENFGQQSETLQQQSTEQFEDFGQPSQTLEQQNTEQQFENFEHQSETSQHQNTEQFGNIEQQSSTLDQKNKEHHFLNNGQVIENSQNTDDKINTFGQSNQNHPQQSTNQQFINFGEPKNFNQQNTEQKFEYFKPGNENIYQQNTEQQFESFIQPSENQKKQNTEQKFENFGASEDLNQQNTAESFDNFGDPHKNVQNQNTEQQFESFIQPSENQKNQNTEQQFENFGASEDLNQQNTVVSFENFGYPHKNIQNQNSEQQSESFIQTSENQNTEQQFENFGAFEDLNQQSTVESFENVEHPHKNVQNQTTEQQFENFDQQSENQEIIKQLNTDEIKNNQQLTQIPKQVNNLEVISPASSDPKHKPYNDDSQHVKHLNFESVNPSMTGTDVPSEITNEKPGFWKNVGNKFVSAKDTVYSWFQKS